MITISKSLFATSAAFLHVYVMIFDISSLFSWQSVLVTIDRHEWYASPQIYTRDDNSGLWIGKQALPDVNKPMVNGVTSMETSSKSESYAQDESVCGIKKRKVVEEISADYTLNEPNIASHEDPRFKEDTVVSDSHGCVAEREIEPTLVMFEVNLFTAQLTHRSCYYCSLCVKSIYWCLTYQVHVPSSCMLDGVHAQHFFGTGVIVHHSENMGLVAVDKNTVAISASDIMLSFAAFPMEIPAEVYFLMFSFKSS